MIRRRTSQGFLLIPQAQHARLAGDIARQIGGVAHAPFRTDELSRALKIHAVGFDAFDARLPLDATGRPMNFDQIPMVALLQGWGRSAELAVPVGPYAALLVSILMLQRSAAISPHARSLRENFEINKLQQSEFERQTALRKELGLRTDLPLKNGLPDLAGAQAADLPETEQQLAYDYRLMIFSLQLALEICTRRNVFGQVAIPLAPTAPNQAIEYSFRDRICELAPFPFVPAEEPLSFAGRLVAAQTFDHELELQELLESIPLGESQILLAPGGAR